ncbi:unnamed protein product [Trypanosoma congolense IL3000]|uniref:WGS project CAEQ00000000 data, annotated contig 1281 n=1 Tax=Trypanosoma congolense (strain IL3000) TaxID=1068625 RepID=F9W565_TRYCI|nr:unnamed protein product [Trypanosoma congolense IL3000]
MPATSVCHKDPILSLGVDPALVLFPVRQDRGRQEALGYQRSKQYHQHSGVNEVVRMLLCTGDRTPLDVRRNLLFMCGDVERNPVSMIHGAQWNFPTGDLPSRDDCIRTEPYSVSYRKSIWRQRNALRSGLVDAGTSSYQELITRRSLDFVDGGCKSDRGIVRDRRQQRWCFATA